MVQNEQPSALSTGRAFARAGRLNPASLVLGLAYLGLVGGVLSGEPIPFVSDDRTALLTLAVLGLGMCAVGPLSGVARTGRWLSPGGLFGVLVGVAALGLVGGVVAGVEVPFIDSDREAFIALAAIMLAKALAGVLYRIRA